MGIWKWMVVKSSGVKHPCFINLPLILYIMEFQISALVILINLKQYHFFYFCLISTKRSVPGILDTHIVVRFLKRMHLFEFFGSNHGFRKVTLLKLTILITANSSPFGEFPVLDVRYGSMSRVDLKHWFLWELPLNINVGSFASVCKSQTICTENCYHKFEYLGNNANWGKSLCFLLYCYL